MASSVTHVLSQECYRGPDRAPRRSLITDDCSLPTYMKTTCASPLVPRPRLLAILALGLALYSSALPLFLLMMPLVDTPSALAKMAF